MGDVSAFSKAQLELLDQVSQRAEELTGDYFQIAGFGPRRYLYEVATAGELRQEEEAPGAFAQICRYVMAPPRPGDRQRAGRYYRVCLQDPSILEAVQRTGVGFVLESLLLYIMTHELIHIVRFERFQHPFLTDPDDRIREEQRVHHMTYELLGALGDPAMESLLTYYRSHRMPRCL